MAEQPLSLNIEYFPDPTKGKPVYNGSVYIGQPDLDPAVEANRVSVTLIQEDGTRVTIAPSAQPLTTGAGGTVLYLGSPVVVLVDGVNSVKVLNNAGSQVYYAPRANESATVNQNEGVLVINGSFEDETQLTGAPDNWTLNSSVNGSIAIDSTDQAHGLKSLKFTGVDATGSGTATSSRFNVLAGGDLDIRFTYKSSAVDTLNKVDIKYYNAAGAVVTTTNVYSEGTANPATYTSYIKRATAPATAIQAEIIITGVDAAGAATTATTNFDDVSVSEITGTEAVGKSGAVLKTVSTASAVNKITVTNAATGNKPSINQTGADNVGIDIEGVEIKNGDVTGFINTLKQKIINIGDWDMDASSTVSISHGVADFSKIRSISVSIINDASSVIWSFPTISSASSFEYSQVDATNIVLIRATGGNFDNTLYNSTGFNRGYIVIDYIV